MSSNDEISPRNSVELAGGYLHTAGVDDGNVTRSLILFSVEDVEAGGSGQRRWLQRQTYLCVPSFADN